MSFADRIAYGVKASFGARIVKIVTNALLLVILTRFLFTTEQYGLLYTVISVVGVASMFATLGLPSSAARYVAEYSELDASQVPHILKLSVLFIVGFGVFTAIILSVFNSQIASLMDEAAVAPLLFLAAIYVIFESLHKYVTGILQGLNEIALSAGINALAQIGRLVFAVGLVLLGFEVWGALAGYLLGFVLSATIGGWILYSRFYKGLPTAPEIEDGLTRRILEYSVPLTATRGATVVDKKVDTILVTALAGLTPAAFYAVAKQVSDACVSPASSLGYTISPAFGEDKAGDRLERAARLYEYSLEHILIFYIPATVGLILVAEPMMRHVFGTEYLGATPVIQVFSLFILANAVNKITTDSLDYLGRARIRAIFKGGMAVSNVILNILLIPIYGATGAAVASVITFGSYTLLSVYIISIELPVRFDTVKRPIGRILVIAGVMGSGVGLLLPYVTGIVTLVSVIGVGGGIWFALSAVWGVIDVEQLWSYVMPSSSTTD
jgi:O-antigen/teichoic acid export membrane protein